MEFGKNFEEWYDVEDANWKKFWEALVERNEPSYDGNDVVEIYKEISGLDDEEAIDELWQYFDDLFCGFNKEVKYYDLEKAYAGLKSTSKKFLKGYLITIDHQESMCDSENLFEDDFKVTIEKIDSRREEFAKEAANKFSSIEDFARWIYDNSSQFDKLLEKVKE